MSIRKSFILIICISLTLVAGGALFAVRVFTEKNAAIRFPLSVVAQLDVAEDIIRNYLRTGEQYAKSVAALPETLTAALARKEAQPAAAVAAADAALSRRLETLLATIPNAQSVFCGFSNGAHVAVPSTSLPVGYDQRTQSWYSGASWDSSDVFMTDASISSVSKSPVVTVAAKIADSDNGLLGVAAIGISLAPLNDALRGMQPGRTDSLVVFDAKGRVLLGPKMQINFRWAAADTDAETLPSLAQQDSGVREVARENVPYVIFSRFLTNMQWNAALFLEYDQQTSSNRETFFLLFLVGGGALLLICISSFLVIVVTRPLHQLIAQSNALASGDLEALAGIPDSGADIATLHGNLGRLVGRIILLTQAEGETARSQADMADKGETRVFGADSPATEETLTPATADITAGVAALLEQSKDASAKVSGALHTTDGIRAEWMDVAHDTAALAKRAAETEANADVIMRDLQTVVFLAQDLTDTLDSAMYLADSLLPGLKPLKSIAGDVAVAMAAVRELADRANILALNISIEAAGAHKTDKNIAAETAEGVRALAEHAMALATNMNTIVALFEQNHTTYALTADKTAASAKHAHLAAARASLLIVSLGAKSQSMAEQVRVLATSLAGVAELSASGIQSVDNTLHAVREIADTLATLSATLTNLTILSTHFVGVADALSVEQK